MDRTIPKANNLAIVTLHLAFFNFLSHQPLHLVYSEKIPLNNSPMNLNTSCYTYTVLVSAADLVLSSDSRDIQSTWLQAFGEVGLEILQSTDERDEKVQNAKSIFEFEANTIDGELVSLEKYR